MCDQRRSLLSRFLPLLTGSSDISPQIRGEFMRASRILSTRPDRAMFALAQLCEDREEDIPRSASQRPPARHYPPSDTSRAHSTGAPSPTIDNRPYLPHRLSNASLASTASTSKSAQSGSEGTTTTTTLSTPISISHPNGTPIILPTPSHLQQHSQSQSPTQTQPLQLQRPPPRKPQLAVSTGSVPNALAPPFIPSSAPLPIPSKSESMTPPPHMAPRRSKWTKPPSEHASPTRQSSFEERFANGLKLAVVHHPNALADGSGSSPGSSVTEDEEGGDDLLDAPSIRSSSSSQASSFVLASLAADGRSGEEDEGTESEKKAERNLNGRGRRPSVRRPFGGETLPEFPPSSSTPRPHKVLCAPIPPSPVRGPPTANGGQNPSEQGATPSSVPNANAGMVLYPIPPFYHYQFQHHQPQMPTPSHSSSGDGSPSPYQSRSFDKYQQGGPIHSFSPHSHAYQKWNGYNTPPQPLPTTMFGRTSIVYSDRPNFIHPNGQMQFHTPPQSTSPTNESRASPEISLAVPQAVGNTGS